MMTNREAIKELKNLAIDEYDLCSEETCFECENKCYVLVSFENADMPMIARYTVDKDGGSAFYIGDEDETFAQHCLSVNAWRRLPECYKEV